MTATPKVAALRGGHVTLAAAADAFLATQRTANPNTHRAYASAIDRVVTLLGRDRPLAEVADAEVGQALAELWGASAPATWNRNRAAVASWLLWCQAKMHWAAPSVPADAERRKETADETRAVAKTIIHRLLSRRGIPLREKTLWRMLYETAARAAEILALNVEDLDLKRGAGLDAAALGGAAHTPPESNCHPQPDRRSLYGCGWSWRCMCTPCRCTYRRRCPPPTRACPRCHSRSPAGSAGS
ncbi:hypothetical protein AB0J35_48590 [Nonomuraea angiospora]|uniref:hypothetical protein n=1 Tax=Nonomuraea angiospora TaxID=46172 RepID=UPI003435C4EF